MPNHQKKYPRGSEWRKWDLHVHTPASLTHHYGNDSNVWDKFIEALSRLPSEFKVLGINDYIFLDGYKKVLAAKDEGKLPNIDLLLPVIELRLDKFGGSNSKLSRVNYHVIFSDEIHTDIIESQFLNALCSKYVLTHERDTSGKGGEWSGIPNRQSLEDLGKAIIESVPESKRGDYGTPLLEGFNNLCINFDKVNGILSSSYFKGQVLTAVGKTEWADIKWNDQSIADKKTIINSSDLVFISSATPDEWAKAKKSLTESNVNNRLLDCSDAHCYADSPEKDRLAKCFTWIKADPSFQGLRQILNEPEDRIFVGDIPDSLIRISQRSTRIVKSVAIKKIPASSTSEKWFDCDIPLNSELIAVIGKKGSGKSALSDILGLLGNTSKHSSFSFLRHDRFRNSKNNKAKQFTASLAWADDTIEKVTSLDNDPNPEAVEKVKYIPQNYLEEICNEIELGKGNRFYNELQQVIFSHVPESEKFGFETLDKLLSHRSEETNKAIEQLITQLAGINTTLITTEERLSPQHRKSLESQLAEKNRELEALVRPSDVQKPEADPTAQQQSKAVADALEKKQTELKEIENEIAGLEANDAVAAKKRTLAEKLVDKLNNLERQLFTLVEDAKSGIEELSFEVEQLIEFKINTKPVSNMIASINSQRAEIAQKLNAIIDGSIANKKKHVVEKIENLQTQLSAPQRVYQAYLQARKEWELNRNKIIGNKQTVSTIRYFENQLTELSELPETLKKLRRQRTKKMLEIFREKQKLRSYYESYYGSVQKFLEQHPLAESERFQLTFNVSMTQSDFAEKFLNRINRRKVGSFMGEEDGGLALKRLLDSAHFDTACGIRQFTRTLFQKMREHDGKPIEIKDQLRQGITLQELYDYVFSLSFLSPIYNLQWERKELAQLSPGERGNLLLIFYLLIDQDGIPLVIDQPEENLDNQTVFKTLVPCIKDAKKRRQIILVTHNPNLAVVCDAEQIICAEMDKEHNNTVTYTSGAIEDNDINRRIVDILEGTRPAFDKRDDKYIS
jgi:ABC-type lipoprotein export system ATPase subunit